MKRLYLMRHAKANDKLAGKSDFERTLHEQGKQEALRIAQQLQPIAQKLDLIISSPAKRALKTAEIVANTLQYPVEKIITEALIYEGDAWEVIEYIHRLDDTFSQVMLVGHNPDLIEILNYLLDARISNISPASVFAIDYTCESWQAVHRKFSSLVYFNYPEQKMTG